MVKRREFIAGTLASAAYLCKLQNPGILTAESADNGDIAYLRIHPGIGIARVGNNTKDDGYYIGPEVVQAPYYTDLDSIRDPATGSINRQGARFRIYAYNAKNEVLREITMDDAEIEWTVQVANRKSQWYQFRAALDISEAHGREDMRLPQRNPGITGDARDNLAIIPKAQSLSKKNALSDPLVGTFDGSLDDKRKAPANNVTLGHLRTDEKGRLIFLGGFGESASPLSTSPFQPEDPNTFNNADGWYDDTCDGLISAKVKIAGKSFDADDAWVIVAAPNYAPDVIGWRTLYDLLVDVYVNNKLQPPANATSFQRDIYPILQRLSGLQWVNKGFYELFGKGKKYDFDDPTKMKALSDNSKASQAARAEIVNQFRLPGEDDAAKWPPIYGDSFGMYEDLKHRTPRIELAIDATRATHLTRWKDGAFIDDYKVQPSRNFAKRNAPGLRHADPFVESRTPLKDQPAELDRAALDYCLADAFHPGCELTYPMRHVELYRAPFRIKHRKAEADGSFRHKDFGKELTADMLEGKDSPFASQIPGTITQWMAIPWQGDTVFCRSGYDPEVNPYLPAYWPARVPNQVLTEEDYKTVMNEKASVAQRMKAFEKRPMWHRAFRSDATSQVNQMVRDFGKMGIIVAMPGPKDSAVNFPSVLLVEMGGIKTPVRSSAVKPTQENMPMGAQAPGAVSEREQRILDAGWPSVEVYEEFQRIRGRRGGS